LRAQWPSLLAVMSHVSEKSDSIGVLRGDQPVTYDISLHGPNMFVGALWLAALRAMSEMSSRLGEPDTFTATFKKASIAYDELLWNGEFYAQPSTGEDFDFGKGCPGDKYNEKRSYDEYGRRRKERRPIFPCKHFLRPNVFNVLDKSVLSGACFLQRLYHLILRSVGNDPALLDNNKTVDQLEHAEAMR